MLYRLTLVCSELSHTATTVHFSRCGRELWVVRPCWGQSLWEWRDSEFLITRRWQDLPCVRHAGEKRLRPSTAKFKPWLRSARTQKKKSSPCCLSYNRAAGSDIGADWKQLRAVAERGVLCNHLDDKALFTGMLRLSATIHRDEGLSTRMEVKLEPMRNSASREDASGTRQMSRLEEPR
jgi:hypothetical protein